MCLQLGNEKNSTRSTHNYRTIYLVRIDMSSSWSYWSCRQRQYIVLYIDLWSPHESQIHRRWMTKPSINDWLVSVQLHGSTKIRMRMHDNRYSVLIYKCHMLIIIVVICINNCVYSNKDYSPIDIKKVKSSHV